MSNGLKDKIIKQIHQEKPYSYWRFWLIDFLRISTILVLVFGAGLSLAYFVWDAIQVNRLINIDDLNIWYMIIRGMSEILLIVGLLSILLYFLYRQTDLPFVKNRGLVLTSVWVILIVMCTFLILYAQNSRHFERLFMQTRASLQVLPYRQQRYRNLYKEGQQVGKFRGRISFIVQNKNSEITIIVQNPYESNTFILNDKIAKDLKIGDGVIVETDPSDPNKVLRIQLLPPRPFDPFIPLETESVILLFKTV